MNETFKNRYERRLNSIITENSAYIAAFNEGFKIEKKKSAIKEVLFQ